MVSIFNSNLTFSLSAIQAIQDWANENLIDASPPPTGIVENSFDTIYHDMVDDNEGYPSGKPTSFGQYWRGTPGFLVTWLHEREEAIYPYNVEPYLSAPDGYYLWSKTNYWFETDMEMDVSQSCGTASTTARNSCIEISNGEAFWLDDEGRPDQKETWVWKSIFGQEVPHQTWGTINYSGTSNSVCDSTNPEDFEALRAATEAEFPGFNTSENVGPNYLNVGRLPNGNTLINPINGFRCHSWLESNGPTNAGTIQAIYSCIWARLVLIDPNGDDDREDYHQLIHTASDIRDDRNIFPPCCPWYSVGGGSKYKKIPNNGDWIPINFICFRYDDAWDLYDDIRGENIQTHLARIQEVNPPMVTSPNP